MTPEERAELAALRAELNPHSVAPPPQDIGMANRVSRHLLNFVPDSAGRLVDTLRSLPEAAMGALGVESGNVPQSTDFRVVDVPHARTNAGKVADVVLGGIAPEIPALLIPAAPSAKAARILGVGERTAAVIGDVIAGAMSGARDSGVESAAQAGEFGAGSAISRGLASRSPVGRALLGAAANTGIGIAGQAARGNDITSEEALIQVGAMAGLPIAQEVIGAGGRRLLNRKPAAQEVPIDEVITPTNERLALPGPTVPQSSRTWAQLDSPGAKYYDEFGNRITSSYAPSGDPIATHPATLPRDVQGLPGPLRRADERYPRLNPPPLMLDGPPAYGQAATEKRFRVVGDPYTPDAGPIPMGVSERPLLSAPAGAVPANAIEPRPLLRNTNEAPPTAQTPELMALPGIQGSDAPQQGGRLKPLRNSEAGKINPVVLGGVAGASVGAVANPDDPVTGAMMGAALTVGGVKGAQLLRTAKIREAADRQMNPATQSRTGAFARWMEKNVLGKDERLTALDDRAKGEADMWAKKMEQSIQSAGRMSLGENLTPAQKAAGEAFIKSKGDPVDLAALRRSGAPAEYQRYLTEAKEAQKFMQGILMRAESDPKKAQMIADSLGTYQTRQYRYFLDDDFKVSDADMQTVAQQWKSNPVFAGVAPNILDDVVSQDLQQHLRDLKASGGDYTRLPTEGTSKISQALYKNRKDLTPEYRKLLGEIDDPHQAQVLTLNKLVQNVSQAKIIGDLKTAKDANGYRYAMTKQEWQGELSNALRTGDKAKADFLRNRYVETPDNPALGWMQGPTMTQRQVADYFQFKGHEGMKTDFGWVSALNQIPKAVFTRGNIGTWVRNYAQMFLQGHALGVFDPSRILKTAYRLENDKALKEQLLRAGVLGAHAGKHEFGKQASKLVTAAKGGLKARIKAIGDMINEGYGKPDQWIRATAYLEQFDKGIAKGLSAEEAGLKALEFVNRYSANYGQVSRVVGAARNVPVVNPFISYSAEMARIIKNLAQDVVTGARPIEAGMGLMSLLAMPAMLAYAAKELSLSDSQKEELKKMEALMPDYMRGRLNAAFDMDEKGNLRQANLQPWFPAGDFISMARNILNADGSALMAQNPIVSTSGTPLVNAAVELYTGKDLVTGEKTNPLNIVAKNVIPMKYRIEQVAKSFTPNDEGGYGLEQKNGRSITPGTEIAGLFGFSSSTTSKKRLLRRAEAEIDSEIASAKKELRSILQTNAAASVKQAARDEFKQKQKALAQQKRELFSRAK